MDKNVKVLRSFAINPSEDKNGVMSSYLHMYSSFQGSYGNVVLSCAAMLDDSYLPLNVKFVQTSGEDSSVLFEFRSAEILHFLHILSLFNPLNNYNYGVQEKQTPEDSPEF